MESCPDGELSRVGSCSGFLVESCPVGELSWWGVDL